MAAIKTNEVSLPDWLKRPDRRGLVIKLVLTVLCIVWAGELVIQLAAGWWEHFSATRGWTPERELPLRIGGLCAAFVLLVGILWLLWRASQKEVAEAFGTAGVKAGGKSERKASRAGVLFIGFVIFFIAEALLAEIVIVGAGSIALPPGAAIVAMLAGFLILAAITLVLAAFMLQQAKHLVISRLVPNEVDQPEKRFSHLMVALSKPDERMNPRFYRQWSKKLGNRNSDDPYKAFLDRLELFDERLEDPTGMRTEFEDDVKNYKWRQIALSYGAQIGPDTVWATLPKLIVIGSKESLNKEIKAEFEKFVMWLVEPFRPRDTADKLPTGLLDFGDAVDFEDFGSCSDEIRKQLDKITQSGVKRSEVLLDITSAQRPWAIAVVANTLDSEDEYYAYVTQSPEPDQRWIRFYSMRGEADASQNVAGLATGGH